MFVTVINLIKFVVKLSLYKIWHVSYKRNKNLLFFYITIIFVYTS